MLAVPKRMVSGGCDNMVRVWAEDELGAWNNLHVLEEHKEWVRDVAWGPHIGLPYSCVASCSQACY